MTLPLFNDNGPRSIGILAHLSSLPSSVGIGTLGEPAARFLEVLEKCGLNHWQMCPVGPTGYGDSPYQSFSAFAGNPYFLDLYDLIELRLLSEESLKRVTLLPQEYTDYGNLYPIHLELEEEIGERFGPEHPLYEDYENFIKEHAEWLEGYSAFRAFKEYFDGHPWWEWEKGYRTFHLAVKTPLYQELKGLMKKHSVVQYFFFRQWKLFKENASSKGIELIGDMPIFVALDSADIWSHGELFDLNNEGMPEHLAGVPPDYFSPFGQFWGNPLYRWEENQEGCFDWWIKRLKHTFKLFDNIRIDHFRGFESYWQIPANAKDARTGKWLKGPGIELFKFIKKKIPKAKLIAEDLGMITDEVRQLVRDTGLKKMGVLQFGFDKDPKNAFLPHHLTQMQVLYSGTHDNDTSRGWYENLDESVKDQVRRYFRISGSDIAWDMIRAIYGSTSNLGIITLQDVFSKDSDARMNTPGSADGNWQWRCTGWELALMDREASVGLRELKWLYDR